MRYLIAGGVGLIDSHLADRLTLRDEFVPVFSNIRYLEGKERFSLIVGDMLDSGTLDELLADADMVV